MKQLLLVLWLAMASLAAYSQTITNIPFDKISSNDILYVNATPLNVLPTRYCEISLIGVFLSPIKYIKVDYGQNLIRSIPDNKQYFLATSAPNTYISVQSNVQLLNFMDEHGWKLVAPMPYSDSSGTRYAFLIERKTP